MKKKERGITVIALVVTIVVTLIIAGVSIGSLVDKKGTIKEANEAKDQAQKESLIEKIEADLYNEKIKTGKMPTEDTLKSIIDKNNYGTYTVENGKSILIASVGNYKIFFTEILGWK